MYAYGVEGSKPDTFLAFASPGGRYLIGRSGDVRGGTAGNNITGLDKGLLTARSAASALHGGAPLAYRPISPDGRGDARETEEPEPARPGAPAAPSVRRSLAARNEGIRTGMALAAYGSP